MTLFNPQGLHPHRGPFVIDVKERGPLTFNSAFAVFSLFVWTVGGSKLTTNISLVFIEEFTSVILILLGLSVYFTFIVCRYFMLVVHACKHPRLEAVLSVKQAFSWMFAAIVQFFRLDMCLIKQYCVLNVV